MNKLKICVVAALMTSNYRLMPWGGKAYGLEGTARLAHELTLRLKQKGYTVTAITDKPLLSDGSCSHDYTLYQMQFSIKDSESFRKIIEKINPDVIHFHGGMQMAYLASIYLMRTHVPSIFTFTHPPSSGYYRFGTQLMKRITPIILKIRRNFFSGKVLLPFNQIIVQTDFLKRLLVSEGFSIEEVSVVPYGLQEKFLHKISKNTRTLNFSSKQMVLYWGAATCQRGFNVFLEAAKVILNQRSNIIFVVATTLMHPTLRDKAKRLNQTYSNFQLFDSSIKQSPFDIVDIVQSATLIVLPFLGPTAIDPPLTLLESAVLGKCVISTPVLSITEIIGENRGTIVMPAPIELANSIIKLLDDRNLRTKISENLQFYVQKKFDWELTLNRLSTLYQRVSIL